MAQLKPVTRLQAALASDQQVVIAEVSPPACGEASAIRQLVKDFAGKVHALGFCDNRRELGMSALAAAAIAAGEGVEPILHVTTRDRNRIALASDGLGAAALGIRNILCTTGTHQTLGHFRQARNVHDIDCVQLIAMYCRMDKDASLVGEAALAGAGQFCIGGTAAPFADPLELQVSRLDKKMRAGAQFLVTQPVFDLERFTAWWQEVTRRGLQKKIAILAGVRVLTSADEATAYAQRRPSPRVPEALLARLSAKSGAQAQRQAGIEIACETIKALQALAGLRGFGVSADGDSAAAATVLAAAGLRAN